MPSFYSFIFYRFTKLSTDLLKSPQLVMMKFHWKPALREVHPPPPPPYHSHLHLRQFSLEWDPCLPTGKLIRTSSKFTWPFPPVRRSSWTEMWRSSVSISTPSQRRTFRVVLPPAPAPSAPPPPSPPAGWGGEGMRESVSPGVSRALVSPSRTSPPSLPVSPTVRLPASKVGF